MSWIKYPDLEPIRRLQFEGRELLGKEVLLEEKRDGENVSVWLDEAGEVRVSSHNMINASSDIVSRLKRMPEYPRIVDLLTSEFKEYGSDFIAYGESLLPISPTRIERSKKNLHWVLFDLYDRKEKRFISYTRAYQLAHEYKIPIVKVITIFTPMTFDEIVLNINQMLDWCKRHRREGTVGKNYSDQIFFKEKLIVPRAVKIPKSQDIPVYPPMDEERIIRTLQHAFDQVGTLKKWEDKSISMPVIAKHFSIESKEHLLSPPRDLYKLYLMTFDVWKEKVIPKEWL